MGKCQQNIVFQKVKESLEKYSEEHVQKPLQSKSVCLKDFFTTSNCLAYNKIFHSCQKKKFGFRMFYENLKKITSGKKTTVFHNIILELANWKKKSYTLLSFFSLQLSCWMCSSHLLREVFALSQNNMREIQ